MPSLVARAKKALAEARSRSPLADHLVRMQQHYGRVNAGSQAGAVTYFAFLSFFPILALAFVAVGYITRYFPDAQSNLVEAIDQVFPDLIGTGEGQIRLESIQQAAATIGIIGVATLVYAGLGWLSGMRTALHVVFELPRERRPPFLLGKLRDLVTLVVVGSTLLLSVAVSGVVTRFSTQVLDLAGLDHDLSWTVEVLAVVVAMAATTLMFFVLFKVLARPRVPDRALWQGALLGSVAFEVLKQLSSFLLAATQRSPAFQAFGIALILLVWINYFSRIVMYAAAWAYTSTLSRDAREAEPSPAPDVVRRPEPATAVAATVVRPGPDPRLTFGAGAATALGLVALVRRRRR
jgi:membrane protein